MRANIDAASRRKFCRAQVIEKDERAHHLSAGCGQHAPHLESAEIAGPRFDDAFDTAHARSP
jgi:hypothetical protein